MEIDYEKIIADAIASVMKTIEKNRPSIEEIKNDTSLTDKEKKQFISKTDVLEEKLNTEIKFNKNQFVLKLQNFCNKNQNSKIHEIISFAEGIVALYAINIAEEIENLP